MNKEKLYLEMNKKGVKIGQLCKDLGMSRSAFYRKCEGKTQFTQVEIQRITDYLELKSPMGIFFEEKVS